jgi:hypothetical protein
MVLGDVETVGVVCEGEADSWLLLVFGRLMSEDRGKRGGEGLSCVGSGRL